MKKQFFLKFMLLLCALLVGWVNSAWADDYVKYSGALTEGDYVLVYSNGALKNTASSYRLDYSIVSISNNKISNPEASIVWHIAASGDYWTIYNSSVSKYAGGTTTKNQAALLSSITDYAKWTVTGSSTYDFTNKGRAGGSKDTGNKYLRRNGDYGFACYASATGGALSLYKKQASSFSVTYNGNGNTSGTVPTDATAYSSGATVTVLGNTGSLAKTGYTFSGWNTKDDGTGTNYTAGNTFSISANTTLYAKWTADSRAEAGIAYTNASESAVILAGTTHKQTLTNPNSLSVTYTSSDTDVATVASDGTVTLKKAGTATITASFAGDEDYKPGSASYTLTITDKYVATLVFDADAVSKNTADAAFTNAIATDPDAIGVAYSSSNTGVATVNSSTGEVTIVAPGSTTIKATINDDDYEATEFTYTLTVSKANTTLTLDNEEVEQDLKDGRTVTLTPTVKATKSDDSKVTLSSPTVTWTSSDETVATVSAGVVTGLKAGETTITASYAGGDLYNAASDATCSVTFTDTRTGVSISTFTADKTSIVIGDTQETTITNDQAGWTAAYTYSSSNTSVATVDEDGVITAVAKGTATITATIVIALDETGYKAGTTASKTLDITVTKPFHTVTFSVNGNTGLTASVEEDQKITFPTAVETTPGDNQFAKVINGMTFVGWYGTTYNHASTAPTYINTSSTNMGDSDVTYYAVYADKSEEESDEMSDAVKSQTLQYDTWTYSGTTAGKSSYRLFGENAYIESASLNLSKIMKVIVYAGTYGTLTSAKKKVTVMAGNDEYGTASLSTNKEGTANTVTSESTFSGNGKVKVVAGGGDADNNGIRISKVEIYVKGTITSYSNYNTTVSALPKPIIAMDNVEMTWGDTDKSVVPTATVGEEAYNGSFSFTSSSPNRTVATDGKLTCNVPGSYTVTASIAATGEHQAAEKSCTVTVNKQDITLAFDEETAIEMVSEGSYTKTAAVSPVAYDGEISYAITSDTSDDAAIDDETGELAFSKTAVIEITATASATDKYNGNTASYTLYVKTTPTITVSDQTLALGKTYEPTIVGGAATITGSPTGLFTEEGGIITAVAIGTTTVTITTAANDTYVAGNANFTLTVNGEPSGLSALPEADDEIIFNETFAGCNDTGGNDNTWGGFSIAGNDTPTFDETGWTPTSAYAGSKCLAIAASGKAKTPQLGLDSETTYTLSFRAACWQTSKEITSIYVAIDGDAKLDKKTSQTISLEKSKFNTYSFSITEGASNSQIEFESSGGRFFLDDVKITGPGTPIGSVEATISGDDDKGFGTFCSLYPLSLPANNADYAAYIVTKVEGSNVTFKKISGEIKGGVPFILYGTPGNYDLPTAASSSTVPAGNLLSGTLAKKYVTSTDDDYCFGISKSSGKFVRITGIIPANKAYLCVDKSLVDDAGARQLNIIFDDDDNMTTGITNSKLGMMNSDRVIYDLQGRKVEEPSKKGLYIVNGRKVVVK